MSVNPQVSICIPVFNGVPYLEECLQSALEQTVNSLEILVSDDGSEDDSLQFIRNRLKDSGRPFRVFENERLGIAGNCNFLIEKAQGEYIKFLFQDDWLEPNCTQKLLEGCKEAPEASLAFSNRKIQLDSPDEPCCQQIYEGCKNLPGHWSRLLPIQPGRQLLEDPALLTAPINKIGEPTTTLLRKSSLERSGGFDPEMDHLLDLDLWLRLMTVGQVVYVDQYLSTFRIHGQQQSILNLAKDRAFEDTIRLYRKLLTHSAFSNMDSIFKSRAMEKLVTASIRDRVPLEDLLNTRKQLKWLTEDRERLLSNEAELLSVQQNLNIAQHQLDRLHNRISFMESTLAWKTRKKMMGVYYFFNRDKNPKQKKKQSNSSPPQESGISLLTPFEGYTKIRFYRPTNVKASIIIPFFNQIELTHQCLKSIDAQTSPDLDFEIILVDDCSDETVQLEQCLEGVKLHQNTKNQGFVHSCNTGASIAKGEYLVFLNNDTQVTSGWLDNMLETFNQVQGSGIVGCKLLFPDGRLQEAGGIIWRDGTGCNYGKWDNPSLPQYEFVREVDYCSGASLAITGNLFHELGGFSEKYAPAYYEDTDLCFRARAAGHKVLYQPKSVVYHVEGATSGTSEESGEKIFQKRNRSIFLKEWGNILASHNKSGSTFSHRHCSAVRHMGEQKILVIDSYVPFHDKESGCQRLFQLLKILQALGYHILFLPDNGYPHEPYTSELRAMGIEVLISQVDNEGWQLLGQYLDCVDIAWVCRPELFEKYQRIIRENHDIQLIYDTVDLHFLRIQREWEIGGKTSRDLEKKWKSYLAQERNCSDIADLTFTVTEEEAKTIRTWGNDVHVVPNVHLLRDTVPPPIEDRNGLLFIGSYNHPPNIDAALWLCQEIMPLIWQSLPELSLTLLGSNPTPEVKALANDKITVPGYISQVDYYFDKARVFVAPLRYGAGMKGKIGHSMCLGLPVITTSIGAEGMGLVHGENVIIADKADDFATQIIHLYEDCQSWQKIANASSASIARFSPESIQEHLKDKLSRLLPQQCSSKKILKKAQVK